MPDYRAESCQIKCLSELQQSWCELQQRADCSYFQSWGWIGTWLEQIAIELEPVVVKIWQADVLVGMGLFVPKRLTRHRVFHSSAMFLNEAPFNGRNMVIEYNGLLADKDHAPAVYREVIRHMLNFFSGSDEFFFSGLSASDNSKLLQANHGESQTNLKVIEQSQTWSLDLDGLEQGTDGFLKSLSKNRRAQLRRSIKAYEAQGPLVLEAASSKKEALLFFDGLKQLHTDRWRSKGSHGSFANPLWEQFHRTLISSRFDEDEVQLLRVCSAGSPIAYLYNFIWRKRVYVLQTGFRMSADKQLMPGYVAHVLAIAHNKQKGMEIYDLLHGDSLYKKILCDQSRPLYWLVLQRNKFKFLVEDRSRSLARYLKKKIRRLN